MKKIALCEKDSTLKKDEKRYRQLLDHMLDGYALHEIICNDKGQPVDYRFLEVNPAFERMTGLKAESMVGHTCLEVMPQAELSWIDKYGKVALTGESVYFENFHQEVNRHFEVTAFCTAPNQFACIFHNITSHKKTKKLLIESEEKFRSYVEQASEGIYLFELKKPILVNAPVEEQIKDLYEGYIIEANDSQAKMYGFDKADKLYGITLAEFHGGTDKPENIEFLKSWIEANYRITDAESNEVDKNGNEIWFSNNVIGHVEDGYLIHIWGTQADITKRKQSELALAAEKEHLAVTLRSIGDGVITTDTKGNIVMLNKAAEILTGWNSNEASGHSLPEVFNIINENTREQCENPVDKVLSMGGIVELANHTCLIAKDGREIVIADSGAPIHDKKNQVIGVVIVFRDMTEKQKLEDSLQRSQKLESLGILAGGIAHDFNNILSAIFGFTELAIRKTSESDVSAYLNKSLKNTERARALTQQLLTFAKGGIPVKKIAKLFPFIQKTVQFALSGSSVSSKFQIQDELRACNLDKNQIGQVIDNLTINAQQAMPNGGTIEVSAQNISLSEKEHATLAAGNYVKLSIKDQGIGIPKEFLPRIFDPYYTTKTKGHGLGLATCYSIVCRHNGCIDVESEPGKGSTFNIYLPATIGTISTIVGNPAKQHSGNGTFLIMDDENAILSFMKEMLESFGYNVVVKTNGADAVDFFAAEFKADRKVAGMIFDLTIPGGMGGKEAINEIRKLCSDTPVFVASGYSEDPIIAHPDEYGFTASISKPFSLNDLSEMLTKHM